MDANKVSIDLSKGGRMQQIFSEKTIRNDPDNHVQTMYKEEAKRLENEDEKSEILSTDTADPVEAEGQAQEAEQPNKSGQAEVVMLVIRQSSTSKSDKGVWTTVPLTKDKMFGPFGFDVISVEDNINGEKSFMYVKHNSSDSDDSDANWIWHLNRAKSYDEHNVSVCQIDGRVYCKTTRDLAKNTELLVWYNDNQPETDVTTNTEIKEESEEEAEPEPGYIDCPVESVSCDYCDKKFVYACHLKEHMKTHTDEVPYECEQCTKKFKWKKNLVTHMQIHHKDNSEVDDITLSLPVTKLSQVEQAENTYKPKSVIRSQPVAKKSTTKPHVIINRHKALEEVAEVDKSKTTSMMSAIGKRKAKKVTYIDRFGTLCRCAVCGKVYSTLTALRIHKRTHTGERPFKCHYCDKSFTQSHVLKTHFLTHTKERPLVCPQCGKGFTYLTNLKRHMRVHTGEKPFKCDICSKCFTQSHSLKSHMSTAHTGNLPYKCPGCEKSFSYKCQKNRHMLKCRAYIGIHTNPLDDNRGSDTSGDVDVSIIDDDWNNVTIEEVDPVKAGLNLEDFTKPHGQDEAGYILESLTRGKDAEKEEDEANYENLEKEGYILESFTPEKPKRKRIKTSMVLEKSGFILESFSPEKKKKNSSSSKFTVKQKEQNKALFQNLLPAPLKKFQKAKPKVMNLSHNQSTSETTFNSSEEIEKENIDDTASPSAEPNQSKQGDNLGDFENVVIKSEPVEIEYDIAAVPDATSVAPQEQPPSFPETLKCSKCDVIFDSTEDLNSHMKSHSDDEPYKCPFCYKILGSASNLKRHIRTHTGETPFKCDICNSTFTQSHSLKAHMRLHSGYKPFFCNICGKKFNYSSHLKRHFRTHTGEKPYCCKICEKKFTQSYTLTLHMNNHHGHGKIIKHPGKINFKPQNQSATSKGEYIDEEFTPENLKQVDEIKTEEDEGWEDVIEMPKEEEMEEEEEEEENLEQIMISQCSVEEVQY